MFKKVQRFWYLLTIAFIGSLSLHLHSAGLGMFTYDRILAIYMSRDIRLGQATILTPTVVYDCGGPGEPRMTTFGWRFTAMSAIDGICRIDVRVDPVRLNVINENGRVVYQSGNGTPVVITKLLPDSSGNFSNKSKKTVVQSTGNFRFRLFQDAWSELAFALPSGIVGTDVVYLYPQFSGRQAPCALPNPTSTPR